MKIYIASSWRNQHGVEMLTHLLRELGHEVISWVENNYGENPDNADNTKKVDFEAWVKSPESDQSFNFDTKGATECDLLIYYSPGGGGKDACCEMGAAYGAGVRIYGLWAKGEDLGLMRKMVDRWFTRFEDLLEAIGRAHNRPAAYVPSLSNEPQNYIP